MLIVSLIGFVLNYTNKWFVYLWAQIVAPISADSFLFCYERDFTLSLSNENQANIIEAFNSLIS